MDLVLGRQLAVPPDGDVRLRLVSFTTKSSGIFLPPRFTPPFSLISLTASFAPWNWTGPTGDAAPVRPNIRPTLILETDSAEKALPPASATANSGKNGNHKHLSETHFSTPFRWYPIMSFVIRRCSRFSDKERALCGRRIRRQAF